MFGSMIPILRSFDETLAKAFYLEFLEFELLFEHRFEPTAPLYMGVTRGACVIHLSEHYGDASPGASLRIEMVDVDSFCRHLNEKKTNHARPGVEEQPWGYREMAINDPFGNRLIFCTELDRDR